MKKERTTEVLRLTNNLDIMLRNSGHKFLAFTTDSMKYDVLGIVNEVADIYATGGKKVLVASYVEATTKLDNVHYVTIDVKNDVAEDIKTKAEGYDIVLVVCPNMLMTKDYLHMSTYLEDVVVVAKKWSSKTANINAIKDIVALQKMNLLGIVYEK